MAWFATALAFLLVSLTLAAAGAVQPGAWLTGSALAVVHLFAIGWLCQMMLGALIQFTPVLCARPLVLPGLSLPVLLLTSGGTGLLAAGFLFLDGWPVPGLFAFAPVVLALGFGLVGVLLVATLIAARSLRQAESRMLVLALVGLAALWATGAAMTFSLAGYDLPPGLLPEGLALHILLGAGGWLTLAAIGVSYKLFAMFLLAPERSGWLRKAVVLCAGLSLGLALVLVAVLIAGLDLPGPLALLTAMLAALTAGLYLAEILRLWRSRRRPQTEVNMRWSRAALGFLGLTALLLPPAFWLGGTWAEAAVFVALVGWLSTLTLAQMVKITAFLTWIQIFAPQIGRRPVPLVQDLTDPRATGCWLGLWTAGVFCGTLSLILGSAAGFRLAALALLVAALGLCHEAVAIRRLRHLDPARRPALLPPLIRPVSLRSSDHDYPRPAGA